MHDPVNGAEAALPPENTSESTGAPQETSEFPFVRNVVGAPGGATDLIYNFKNGQFAAIVSFRVVSPEALGPIGEDFLHFTRDLLEQVKAARENAARQRTAPQVHVVPADALRGMKRPT